MIQFASARGTQLETTRGEKLVDEKKSHLSTLSELAVQAYPGIPTIQLGVAQE